LGGFLNNTFLAGLKSALLIAATSSFDFAKEFRQGLSAACSYWEESKTTNYDLAAKVPKKEYP
jgi:hypothetical protein